MIVFCLNFCLNSTVYRIVLNGSVYMCSYKLPFYLRLLIFFKGIQLL